MDKKVLAIVAVAVLAVAAIAAAFVLMGGDQKDSFEEITDAYGNKIKLDKLPERIVSTTVTATEDVCDLGFREYLVGASLDSHVYDVTTKVTGINLTFDYPATVKADIDAGKITNIGKSTKWTADSVIACNPDLVIIDLNQVSTADGLARMTQIQSVGITCCVLSSENTWKDINSNIDMLGKLFGKQSRANEIIKATEKADKAVLDTFKNVASKKIAHICYCWGSYYIYNESGPLNILLQLGCTNALPTTQSFTTITPDAILAADPDFIVFDDMATGLPWADVIAEWKADPIMGEVNAIKNDKIYCMEYQPFQATSYTTVHYIMGEAMVAMMIDPSVVGVTLPTVITNDAWTGYIEWLNSKV